MFVLAKDKDEVEAFAKKLGYAVENIKKLTEKNSNMKRSDRTL